MPESLNKKDKNDTPYRRRPEIEALLTHFEALAADERTHLFEPSSRKAPDYVPSEALVYFLRRAWAEDKKKEFEQIFNLLMKRVGAALNASINDSRMAGAQEIREEIFGRFAERIAKDCVAKSTWLDFYEICFEKAFLSFQITALRQIGPTTVETVPLTSNEENDAELTPEIECAAADFLDGNLSKFDEPGFRSALMAAIDCLPSDQKQVVGLLLQGFPIDSKDSDVMTIARILQCDERTVRNRRNRALSTLKTTLQEEWMQ
jgi:DNA-directed RNA polymerase specialized sigma24 family protein